MATGSFFWNTVQREAGALLPPTPLVASRDADTALDRTTTVPTGLIFESALVGSRWYACEDTAGFNTGDAIIIEPGDITSSCGLRELVSRGGNESLHHQEWRPCASTLQRRMCAPCQRALTLVASGLFSDAVHNMEEHALHDFPIQGPRTTCWLLLEIAGHGTIGGEKEWSCHHRILELTSTSSYVSCLATARSMTNSIFRSLLCVKQYHDGFICGRNAYAEKLRASTASGVSVWHATERQLFLVGARPKGSALVSPELENGLLHSFLRRQPTSRKEEEDRKNVNWWQLPLIQGPEPSEAQVARLLGGRRPFCARHRALICFPH